MAIGCLLAWGQTQKIHTISFDQTPRYYKLTVELKKIEPRGGDHYRLISKVLAPKSHRGATIKTTVKTGMDPAITVGDVVSFAAMVSHPSPPVFPQSYDFQRKAFFEKLSATGYAVSSPVLLRKSEQLASLFEWVHLRRKVIADRLVESLGRRAGGVAAALLVGRKDYIERQINEDMRVVGLSHVLAISGLHMGLISGLVFLFFEGIFSLIPMIALRIAPRKLAVPFVALTATGYLILSGFAVSTQRAYIMVLVALLALLMNRRAFSLRTLAIAGLMILLVNPYALMTIGFQLSFSATAGLILFYTWYAEYRFLRFSKKAFATKSRAVLLVEKTCMGFLMICLTTIVSQLAITPFSLYHFHTISIIAIVANLLVMPLVTVLIMPIGLLILFGHLIDIEWNSLNFILRESISLMIETGERLSVAPLTDYRSGVLTPVAFSLGLIGTGCMIFIRPKLLGLNLFMLCLSGMLILPAQQEPDLYVLKSGKALIAFEKNTIDGRIKSVAFKNIRHSSYVYEQAVMRGGLKDVSKVKKIKGSCGLGGCMLTVNQKKIALVKEREMLLEVCGQVDLIIHNYPPWLCKISQSITLNALNRYGTHAVYFTGMGKTTIIKAKGPHSSRPWQ
ncbi:ComEC/Rec2 family competence protein [Temperatibacter marinus]|uniref:ComEC/Rec2 family competence protein n=1 Tax=Temperatibacter marinus TaxID=1456591 RepID=A0AA52HA55_9PROT|nr:ComEC/Rec2 family competence protein [Temperatibacter marinus]WND02375.1 ComEC/Rec2 family competence protein [Temperatibacter marinus]